MKKLLTILFISTLFAGVTNNGATLTIGEDVTVTINGDFTNNGNLYNDGSLIINGFLLSGGDGFIENNGDIFLEQTPVTGDSNLDGNINVADITLIVQYIIGDYVFNDIQLLAADLDDSGHVNVGDIILIIEAIFNQQL